MRKMDYERLIQIRNENNNYARYLGIRTLEIREGYAKGEMKVKVEHQNIIKSVHGGCIFSLADTVAGSAAASHGNFMTTLSGNINYLSPALKVDKITAEAREIKKGKNICVYEVEVRSETKELLAKGSFSYFNLGTPIF